ncbi:MAG TPA: alpha/beta hydrolase [Thermoleophilaceae bacterium]|nr:alpha/beta hydrolase [Thermoleophilaceae bacterium]
MSTTTAIQTNGVKLHWELHGSGEPVALVHGSWGNAMEWEAVAAELAASFQVLVYDRRGHSRSERPSTQGSVDEDGDDLAGLLEALDLAPAHVVTNSYGGNIALRLATRRPDLFRSLACHEPPLFSLLGGDSESREMLEQATASFGAVADRIAEMDHDGAARQFIDEVALGAGGWDTLPAEAKATFIENAPTFLDELNDPDLLKVDDGALGRLQRPVLLTTGTESPPLFPRVVDRLADLIPHAARQTIPGAGHEPHQTMPESYAEMIANRITGIQG